jgi:ABC-2 type transport system ATP-binding protein
MIRAENVTKMFGKITACAGITFEVSRGQIVGLLGPNGAGKTTLLKMLSGISSPTQGKITVEGFSTDEFPVESKQKTGCVLEGMPLYESLTVIENLTFIAGMHRIKSDVAAGRVDSIIELCRLQEVAYRMMRNLSKGFRQRICLAQALIHDPPVLLLDEPTGGLDPLQLDEFRSLMREISPDKAIILSTHIMQEVESLCSDVLMINKGILIEQGSISAVCKRQSADTIEQAFFSLVSKQEVRE